MSLYEQMKKENHSSLTIKFSLRAVPDKTNYKGIVAQSSLLEDARKRKTAKKNLKTLDQFFTPLSPIAA